MKITAIIQARMNSSRLPGKVMKPIVGRPLLSHMIDRVKDSKRIDDIVIATTENFADNPIVDLAAMHGVSVFRGSENNVLARYYDAAKAYASRHIMRLTSDCPLIDPEILDDIISFYIKGDYEYVSNCLEPTLPDGLDVEIFSFNTLERIYFTAVLPSHKEHVTLYLAENRKQFKIGFWKYSENLSALRLTVDHYADFALINRIFEIFDESKLEKFRLNDIVQLLRDNPELIKINENIQRNEGLKKSKENDAHWLKQK